MHGRDEAKGVCETFASLLLEGKKNSQSNDRHPLLVVSGPAGVGKRSLIHSTVRPALHEVGGLFLSGHCQPQNRSGNVQNEKSNQPRSKCDDTFGVFRLLLQELVVKVTDDDRLELVKRAIEEEFTSSHRDLEFLNETFGLSVLLPCSFRQERRLSESHMRLGDSKGATTSRTTLSPFLRDSVLLHVHDKFIDLVRRFLQAVATCVPLVLLLDQVQLADAASLELCRLLCASTSPKNSNRASSDTHLTISLAPPLRLLVTVTYRDDGDSDQQIDTFLESFRTESDDSTKPGCWIRLSNIKWDDAYAWTRESTVSVSHWTDAKTRSVVDVIMELSGGNPRYISYLLRWFHQSGFDMMRDAQYVEVLQELGRRIGTPLDIAMLWVFLLTQQETIVIDLVEIASAFVECGSSSMSSLLLDDVLGEPSTLYLSSAKDIGLLEVSGTDVNGVEFVQFPCTELQQTMYTMIPPKNASMLHIRIARTIWGNDAMDQSYGIDLTAKTKQLARHFWYGKTAIDKNVDDIQVVAQVSLQAAQLSVEASEFAEAAECITLGVASLGKNPWSPETYDIALALHNGGAEIYYCLGDLDYMQQLINAIDNHARSFQDKLLAYTTRVFAYSSRNRLLEALALAIRVLHQLGEPLPWNPGKLAVVSAYLRTRWALRGKSDRFFLSLPQATNAEKIAAMQMVNVAFMTFQSTNPNCAAVALFRMLRMALKYGMTGPAIAGIGAYGFVLCTMMQYDEGLRYAKLSLALLDHFETKEWLPRVYLSVYGYVYFWFYPARESCEPIQVAQQLAIKSGDMESWAIACTVYLICSFHTGTQLDDLQDAAKTYCEMMTKFGQTSRLLFTLPLWQLLVDLTGKSSVSLDLPGCTIDVESAVKQAIEEGNNNALSQYYNNCIAYNCFVGEFALALEMADCWNKVKVYPDFLVTFYEGIAAFAVAQTAGWKLRRRCLARGAALTKQMARWCINCPANFLNKQYFMQAEWAVVKGEQGKALSLYYLSIEAAKKYGLVQEEALVCERLGRFHCAIGNTSSAVAYFERARDLYRAWGAEVLAARMEESLDSGVVNTGSTGSL